VRLHPEAPHLLLTLPAVWPEAEFIAAARRRGIGLSAGSAFAVPGPAVAALGAGNAVRLCFGTPPSEAEAERGLRIIAGLLAEAPVADLSVV
jgi:DNA-binding transcriptional MocR family regulator